MHRPEHTCLFEVSWEVCNKVGGIATVLQSKARTATEMFGENYFLLGPDLKTNSEFTETDEEAWNDIREGAALRQLPCRFGRWEIPGRPRVVLVDFRKKYNKDQLLYTLWEGFGVDSISGQWDYIEPVMFSYACGEIIETIYHLLVRPHKGRAVAQFHEWMCGAGILRLKKGLPEIATVFTTHATILGRTLAGSGWDIYSQMDTLSPQREAATYNIAAKHSMETTAAREADCVTTVSDITASEVRAFLGRQVDVIAPNGLDMSNIPDLAENKEPAIDARRRLLDFAMRFVGKPFPTGTRIMLISGRYEFRNKGIDVFLQALKALEPELAPDQPVLAFFLVLAGHKEVVPAALAGRDAPRAPTHQIVTHRLEHEAGDPVLNACNSLGFRNGEENRVHIIFVPAFLNGFDGALNMSYYGALSGCDLGVFPSYYEPWGYTPHESAAYAVPTITTDQAGFGLWTRHNDGQNSGVMVIDRQKKDAATITQELHQMLRQFVGWSDAEIAARRRSARRLALRAEWSDFFKLYLKAYEAALTTAGDRVRRDRALEFREEMRQTFVGISATQPHFRTLTAEVDIPEDIGRLRELAYNLWWSWNPGAGALFSHLDPRVWEKMGGNPLRMLESVSPARLQEMAHDPGYTALYSGIIQQFSDYMKGGGRNASGDPSGRIKWSAPVAYFSMEYGLHESLPLYSGGLGTLSADHLKSASDLNLPLVGVGLLYKSGYFRQRIDKDGWQVAEYPENDFSTMPAQVLRDDRGNNVEISIELPGRTLYATVWEIKVGRVPLYLMDADNHRNTAQDRKITSRLYSADRRARIEQEILLGMGGVRLLQKIGIKPSVYHMNEGHSAFLLLERIRTLMTDEGLSFDEAREAVRAGTVFTTHTPVDAGHERFARDIIEHYFASFVERAGITWSQFWELGRREPGDDKPFYMTLLGLKLSHMRNAVSRMHETVSRRMWRDAWNGFHYSDIPIIHVTNGIHIPTFVDPRMAELMDSYLGLGWSRKAGDAERWKRIRDIPNTLLWQVRCEMRQKLVAFLRENISRHGAKYGDSASQRDQILSMANPSALLIGFARRFAPYKRADLLLSNLDRLEAILTNEDRPVQIIYAGKAHPEDRHGIELLKKIVDIGNDRRFRGRIFFIEDYDIRAARMLVRGVDVWLNTPRRPYEASGTSGQKVVANAVLNMSTFDGWWCEAYDGTNGWTIGPTSWDLPDETRDTSAADSEALYSLLETAVIPAFFNRDASGIPQQWLDMAKRAMETLAPRFNSERMVGEYHSRMYLPTAERGHLVASNGYKIAKELADWKRKIPSRFSSLRLLDISLKGTLGDSILLNKPFTVVVRIDPGKLDPEELLVELLVGKSDGRDFVTSPDVVSLTATRDSKGTLSFSAEHVVRENGQYAYGVRVMPWNKNLDWKQEAGLVLWG